MKKELIAHRDPKSPISEVFRTLRTNIQFMNTSRKLKTILITSTSPGEGKSWVSSNFAVTFAQAGKRVILVDADMRKGRQYTIFGALPKPGLSNFLSGFDENDDDNNDGEKDITQYIQKTEIANLCLLAAGNVPPNPAELLTSPRMIKLLDELKELSDIVIIDGTPCDLVTDSVILSRLVDTTVIVTAHQQTKREDLKRVITNIKNVNGNIAGVVFNKVPISTRKYEQSYYYGSTSSRNLSKPNAKNTSKSKKSKTIAKSKKSKTIAKSNNNAKNKRKMEETINQINKRKENTKANTNSKSKVKTETRKDKPEKKRPKHDETMPYDKQEQILKEINEYIDREKKKLGDL